MIQVLNWSFRMYSMVSNYMIILFKNDLNNFNIFKILEYCLEFSDY